MVAKTDLVHIEKLRLEQNQWSIQYIAKVEKRQRRLDLAAIRSRYENARELEVDGPKQESQETEFDFEPELSKKYDILKQG